MRLNHQDLAQKEQWTAHGFELPSYDREQVRKNTMENPTWIHFGAGNIFRAFTAAVQQELLNHGTDDHGIIVAEGFDEEIIDKAYRPFDDMSLLVVLKADGTIEKKVVGSVVESLKANPDVEDWARLQTIFAAPSLQMVSFTITEKGYSLTDSKGEYLSFVVPDFTNPDHPGSIMGKVAALCLYRYRHGAYPLALVSMDNCSHNGEKLQHGVVTMAEKWLENGLVEEGFVSYLKDTSRVSFPWSMIDKITPRPDARVQEMLKESGFEDTDIIITNRNTYTSAFVNAEEAQYLVVEDRFPNGRPNLEKGGVIFTDRDTVNMVEKMKVCTCLNPLHTALAIFGCLLSHTTICGEMADEDLNKMVHILGYQEGMPVVIDPKIIDPKSFIKEVLEVRLPNPFMPDTPQRIATDTSQKLGIRFGETIKAYTAREDLSLSDLKLIPLVFAGWCRYLMGIDDEGKPFETSPDPLKAEMSAYLADIRLGEENKDYHQQLAPIFSNRNVFGVDLYEVGLGEQAEQYFAKLVAGPGAVRKTLHEAVENAAD